MRDIKTASPRRDVISTGVRSSLTCSMSGKEFSRASDAVIALAFSSWHEIWHHVALAGARSAGDDLLLAGAAIVDQALGVEGRVALDDGQRDRAELVVTRH